jgi:FAD/FMN-containing dehydrogenase
VPLRRGLAVDFHRLNRVIDLDRRSGTVTVEPGIVWQRLDMELARAGLALRLYPTSYAGSTVGGWLAHGGAGLGSFEAGWFHENVVGARIAVPAGEMIDIDHSTLDLVSDAEGTTGLVASITLRVAPLARIAVMAAATSDPVSLQQLLEGVVEADLPLWSVSFVDPGLAAFHEAGPEEYVVSFAFLRSNAPWVTSTLPWIVHGSGAWLLDDDLARREWDRRFRTMRIRRRLPFLVPAEVVVPLAELADVLDEIEDAIDRPIPKEAVVVRPHGAEPQVAIHAFVPVEAFDGVSREAAVGDAVRVVGIAERHGGRPYSTGIYFRDRAERILGRDRVRRIEAFKREVDPRGILNPGKVMGLGALV